MPIYPINKFYEHGFSISHTSENGTIFLSRDPSFTEPPLKPRETEEFFYNIKTGKTINTISLNADANGNPLHSLEIKDSSLCFIKDYVSGEFVRCNFDPANLPLVAFKDSLLFCTLHGKWEERIENTSQDGIIFKSACGCKLRGYFVNIEESKHDVASQVFAIKLFIKADSEDFITIQYLYLNAHSLTVNTQERIISTKTGAHDKLVDYTYIKENNKALPPLVYDTVIRLLVSYTKKRYNIDISYKNFSENQEYISAILESPYEPSLYILQKIIPEIRDINVKSPACFNELCEKIQFKPWRTFRKAFNQSFYAFPIYLAAQLLGFTDKNIINEMLFDCAMRIFLDKQQFTNLKSLSSQNTEQNADIDFAFEAPFDDIADFGIDDFEIAQEDILAALPAPEDLEINAADAIFEAKHLPKIYHFYNRVLVKRGQRATWSLIKRNVKSYSHISDIIDAADIYFRVKRNIDTVIDKKIMTEGLSEYNHNLLVNVELVQKYRNWLIYNGKINSPFDYTNKEKRLECAVDGYAFRLVESPMKLFMLGQILHNCVGNYYQRIKDRACLIVYAMKDGQILMCIEVRGSLVQQCRTKRNNDPKGADLEAFLKWKDFHNLVFTQNHF